MPTEELELVTETPPLETMARADTLAIWEDYDTKAARLIETAKTIVVTDVTQRAQMKLADETRKQVKALRCEIENKRKELVEGFKKAAGKIDETARKFRLKLEDVEAHLLEQSKFAEIKEAEAKAALKMEREALLLPLGANPAMYQLADMTDEDFTQLRDGIKAANDAKIAAETKAKEEAAAKAKADAEERERIRLENERLKAEAIAREAAAQAEREKAAAERKAAEEAALKERQAIEAKAKAEREAAELAARKEREAMEHQAKIEREKAEAAAKLERAARERAEEQLRAAAQAEEEKKRAAAAAAKKAAAAPDKIKLAAFAEAIRALPFPDLSTEAGKALAVELAEQTEKFAGWVEKKSATL